MYGRKVSIDAHARRDAPNQSQAAIEFALDGTVLSGNENCIGFGSIKHAITAVSEYGASTAAAVEEQSTVTSEMSASMQRAAAEASAIARG